MTSIDAVSDNAASFGFTLSQRKVCPMSVLETISRVLFRKYAAVSEAAVSRGLEYGESEAVRKFIESRNVRPELPAIPVIVIDDEKPEPVRQISKRSR